VGVEGLPELFRVVRPGGLIVLSVKMTIWDDGFEAYLKSAERDAVIGFVEVTPSYASMPAGTETSPCVGVVLRVSATASDG
jgi:hypothetical protein